MLDEAMVIVLAGGAGERLYPADAGTGQARGLLRRALPHHRLRPEQLHQLRAPPDLHRHPVQVALAQPPHPHGLERRLRGARGVHRDPAAPEAGGRELVPRHGRRRLPEPVLDRARASPVRRRPRRRPRLQDGLQPRCCGSTGSGRRPSPSRPSRCRSRSRARFGIVQVDERDRVVGFQEKPESPVPSPGTPHLALASMGIYIFDADVLVRALEADAGRETTHDFGQRHHPGADPARCRSTRTGSTTRTRRRPSTGATSARSTPTTRPTWTSSR